MYMDPKPNPKLHFSSRLQGFTLIELMIVIAIVAIILTLALPVYSNYSIRAKVAEGLSLGNAAKTAVSAACIENRNIIDLDNDKAGYSFQSGDDSKDYVDDVQASGACTAPMITITTKNTGRAPDPIILMTGNLPQNGGQMTWRCSSANTPNWLLPRSCRS